MYCEECKMKPANVHITKIINDVVSEVHLCTDCAGKHTEIKFSITPSYMPLDLLSGILPQLGTVEKTPTEEELVCSNCSIKFSDFLSSGMLGCSICYSSFESRLDPIIRRIHGSGQHIGKIHERRGTKLKARREIINLKEELDKAVRNEDYEKAAFLRDRIKTMEEEAGN